MASSKAEIQLKTIKEIIAGYNNPTFEALEAARAEEYEHEVRPKSLNRPNKNRMEYISGVVNSKAVLTYFKMEVYDIINDATSGKAVIHAMGIAESAAGPYRNEYAIFLTFNETGDKVIKEEVFEDSAFTNTFYAKVVELHLLNK